MSKLFNSLAKGVVKIQQSVVSDATEIFDPSRDYGILWENNEDAEICRACAVKFTVGTRKHHCRSCASIYCDSCCQLVPLTGFYTQLVPYTKTASNTSPAEVRLCEACKRGECPSQEIKNEIRRQLQKIEDGNVIRNFVVLSVNVYTERAEASAKKHIKEGALFDKDIDKAIDKLASKAVGKLNEIAGVYDVDARINKSLNLNHGSYYGEDGKPKKNSNKGIPPSGYFEFHNKSSEIVCVKVLCAGNNARFEIPRPSYFAVPPDDTVYCHFNPESEWLGILLLTDNPNEIDTSRAITYDTKAHGAHPERISKCAQVGLFNTVTLYSCLCKGHNVLLKYKGNGQVIPRNGDGIGRVGIFSKLQGLRYSANMLDYSTNVNTVRLEYTVHAPLTNNSGKG